MIQSGVIYGFFQSFSSPPKGRFSVFPWSFVGWNGDPMGGFLKKKKKRGGEGGKYQFFGQICWEVLRASLRLIIILA